MAEKTINSWGYIGSDGNTHANSHIYVSSPSYSLVGFVGFNESINQILKISASLWQEIYYTSNITLELTPDGSVLTDGYTLGLGVVQNPTLSLNEAIVTEENCILSNNTFSLNNLFNKLSDNTIFSPSSSSWYIYIKGQEGANRRFQSGIGTLTINGIIASNLHYNNGTSWERCIPYYYNGTNWMQCQANYYDGNSWIKT